MLKRGWGQIIIISSVAGRMTAPYLGSYCMTKHALEAAAEVLLAELTPHNIKVQIVFSLHSAGGNIMPLTRTFLKPIARSLK